MSINVGKPIPDYVPESYRAVINKLRAKGYGILPHDVKIIDLDRDRGWYMREGEEDDLLAKAGWYLSDNFTPDSFKVFMEKDGLRSCEIIFLRHGYVEIDESGELITLGEGHGRPFTLNAKKKCGHKDDGGDRCIICDIFARK